MVQTVSAIASGEGLSMTSRRSPRLYDAAYTFICVATEYVPATSKVKAEWQTQFDLPHLHSQ